MSWFEPYGVRETGGAKAEQKAWKEEKNHFVNSQDKGLHLWPSPSQQLLSE